MTIKRKLLLAGLVSAAPWCSLQANVAEDVAVSHGKAAGAESPLSSLYVIGRENFESWSQGYDTGEGIGYLKVLPHPDQKVPFKDPFKDWQAGRPGNYFSSWGPEKELNVQLEMTDLSEITIDGFGVLKQGDGVIPWLGGEPTPYEQLRGYNGTIPGPMLLLEPGDTLKVDLRNNLLEPAQVTNLHTHGLHVSPVGDGDNVLVTVEAGASRQIEIAIPPDHFIGPDWYHPHFHGRTNEQVASGLGGPLLINPPYNLPDLHKWDPTVRPGHFLVINTFGIQQVDRSGSADDPLNQNPTLVVPAGTPLRVFGNRDGLDIYELADAPFLGYNAKPDFYDPMFPTGNPEAFVPAYGEGALGEPAENVIHTVNGQYNPTMDLPTGEWNLFSFANFATNSFFVVQLVKEGADGVLTPQEVTLVAIDGDAAGVVEGNRRQITEFPVLNPGTRITVQHWFEEPGRYYFLANATEEVLGDAAPALTRDRGFMDGHLIWGPQVLATVEVTGNTIAKGPFPAPYNRLIYHAAKIDALVEAAEQGDVEREREFVWTANIGGAFVEGNVPVDTDVSTFEGVYRINGEYFSTDGSSMVPLAMPMLRTTEIWNIFNESGLSDPSYPLDFPLLEWHPFHIHQNDFVVLEVNGIPVEEMDQSYLARVLSDTIALPPTYTPGSATPANPYGDAQYDGEPSLVRILMKFEDYPGSYVNHCHILFHEDAGMMAVVRVILNTEDTWLGLGKEDSDSGFLDLFRASDRTQYLQLAPFGSAFRQGIDAAIADINNLGPITSNNVTDNITDIVAIQKRLESIDQGFTVKVFDGGGLMRALETRTFFPFEATYEMENLFTEAVPGVFQVSLNGIAPDAPFGLNEMNGTIWGTILPNSDFTQANGTFSSDPGLFGLHFLEPGYVALEGGGNQVLADDVAKSVIDFATGVVTAKGELDIFGGAGLFAGAEGMLEIAEQGTFNPDPTAPYLAELAVTGTIRIDPGNLRFGAKDQHLVQAEIPVFQSLAPSLDQRASVASGDINGDGFADIVAGVGGGGLPLIEIYSGEDFQLLARLRPFHDTGFDGAISLAAGDVNGDNYDDIIVAQAENSQGWVEFFDGSLIDALVRSGDADPLDPDTAAHQVLLQGAFQPFGEGYTGPLDVTSGYFLQTPDWPNGGAVQTNNANITVAALDEPAEGHEQVKVFTYVGSAHHHDEGNAATEPGPVVRLDAEFTPEGGVQDLAGSFADIAGGDRGTGALFMRGADGGYRLQYVPICPCPWRLDQGPNVPTPIDIPTP